MRIKQHTSGNEYIRAGNVWVRNFTKSTPSQLQISHLFEKSDYDLVLRNESLNRNYPKISDEKILFRKVLIVSDGYQFEQRHLIISDLPKDICILAVNRALNKWGLFSPNTPVERQRTINAYVANNPYHEATSYLPPKHAKYYPVCIASTRTNHQFLQKYAGDVYTYSPTTELGFGHIASELYTLDDYRNPVCAAIGLAHQFEAEKVALFCCDDSFEGERESAVRLENGLFTYPQHLRAQEIIDANLYWLTHQEDKEVKVANYSSGQDYLNASYISTEDDLKSFFRDQEEGTQDE